MSLKFEMKGDFDKTKKWLNALKSNKIQSILNKYGEEGVRALQTATPKESGMTANSWGFRVKNSSLSATIEWYNTNEQNGVNIAILIQYGHGTGTGGYVPGVDYINPAMKPVFESIADKVWKEVNKV